MFQIEERLYPATLMACTEQAVEATSQEAMDRGWVGSGGFIQRFKLLFLRLFSYINGENTEKRR